MKRAYALLAALFFAVAIVAQEEDIKFRTSFVEGSQLMEEFNYAVALDIWLDLLKDHKDNANVNYKAGVCLWKLPKRNHDALPYFEAAVKNVNERFDPFSPAEEGAPIETYFYIANAYHLNYEFDSAIVYYNKFKNHINHNHEFWARTDLEINMCETARKAILSPVDIKVVNLGSLVNSPYPDYAPVISVDESAIYFTSKRLRKDSSNMYAKNPDDGEYFEDIYVTYKGDDGAWNEPEALNFNSSSNEATLSLSADGERLYIYKSGEKGYGDLYVSKLEGINWSEPVKLGSDINTEYHETHAAESPDGRRLYFVSNRKGSLKFPDKAHDKVYSRDIYFCNLLPTGDWALAQPLKELNTPFHEDGVFLHPDGKTMFFSSEEYGSMGGFDIFSSEFQKDSTWGKPVNIGYPINTTDDDIFFVTSASGKRAYYSSTRDIGYGDKDLYVISMLSFKEKPLTLLIGKITAADGSAVPEDIFIYVTDNESGDEIGTFKPRARDNKFTIIIPPGSDYHLEYTYNDSVFYQDDIFVPENSAYQEIEKGISLGAIDFSGINKPVTETTSASAPQAKTGSETPNVEGRLLYGTAGAAGVLVNLTDGDNNKISSTTTDGSGNFLFKNLVAGSNYYVVIDPTNGQVPENAQLYMKDAGSGAMLPVAKMSDGAFGFETLPTIESEELKTVAATDASQKPMGLIAGPKKPSVEGNLKYGAMPAAGVIMNLNDKNQKTLAKATTDADGDFAFGNLTAGTDYTVAIDPSNANVPANAQLTMKDQTTGQMLPVSKLANGSFAFATLPYIAAEDLAVVEAKDQTSAPKNPTVEGNLKYGSAAAAGVLMNLNDKDKKTIASTTTDADGDFAFGNLNAGENYGIAIDPSNGDIPANAQLSMKDQTTGKMLPVSKLANGSFAFATLPYIEAEDLATVDASDQTKAPKHPTVEGNLKYGSAAAAGVLMSLNDKDKNTIAKTTTDADGDFAFGNLNAGTNYGIAIDPTNGDIPSNANLTMKDQTTGKMLPVSRLSDGSFAFATLPYIAAEELSTTTAKEEMPKVEAKKESKKLPPAYKTEVQEIDGNKYIIHEVKEGETMFNISLIYNLKFPVVQAANPDKGDLIYAGDQIKLPIPAEVMFYQEFFDYNVTDINTNSQEYKNFLVQVEKVISENGKAIVMIASSSSKVPSTKESNKDLSVKRANKAKDALVASMSAKGLSADKFSFADMSTLVRGPEYQNDAAANRATYKNYQYVKIIVK